MTTQQIRGLVSLGGYKYEKEIESKEIIPFEEKYLNTANAIQHDCDFPIDIIFDIICHTDEIAPCRIGLLYSVLRQHFKAL